MKRIRPQDAVPFFSAERDALETKEKTPFMRTKKGHRQRTETEFRISEQRERELESRRGKLKRREKAF